MAAREALLKYVRVNVRSICQYRILSHPSFIFNSLRRSFADEPAEQNIPLDRSVVIDRIISVLRKQDKIKVATVVTPESDFRKDLGLGSLDEVEIVLNLEEEFGIEIPDSEADKIHSIPLATKYILSQPDAK